MDEISQSYQPKYESIKGDIYSLQGETEDAQMAYEKALEMMTPGNFEYDFVKMKASEIGTNDDTETADES